MAFTVFRPDELEFDAPSGGDVRRGIVRLSDSMRNLRGNIWRLPPGSRGRRHAERVQEEVFVVLEGTVTMLLGDPPEPVELPLRSVAVVEPGTALQVRNASDAEATVLILGAPPTTGQADYLPDVD
jgi:quercetin dioxygenase-like cupin family protein